MLLSWNSMGPTRTSSPTSARGCSRGSRRVRRLPRSACHEPDTHDDPRRLVRHRRRALFLARKSVGDARVCTCRPTWTVHDKLSCTRLQNCTIGASPKSVSVPWNSSFSRQTRVGWRKEPRIRPAGYIWALPGEYNWSIRARLWLLSLLWQFVLSERD